MELILQRDGPECVWHDVIVAALHRLEHAIAERGGQRRARPYVASQLRRLDPAER